MDKELEQFQQDLLTSVQQMKADQKAHISHVKPTLASQARMHANMTQQEFAKRLGISIRTLQEWEQGRRTPTGAAKTLLTLTLKMPQILELT